MTVTPSANSIAFFAPSGTHTVTTNGVFIDKPLSIGVAGTAATVILNDDITLGPTRGLGLSSGTFDANNKNLEFGQFPSANSNTRTLKMGSGTWTIRGQGGATVWNTSIATNLTVEPATSTVYFASSSAQNIAGGGVTIYDAVVSGAGTVAVTAMNFNSFSNTVQPLIVQFGANQTFTFGNFALAGTAGNQVTLRSSSAGSQATLSQASGTVSTSYLTIQDINATGGATWQAYTTDGNVDAGNNDGWDFSFQLGRYIYTRRKNKRILP
jgi:hypothetical protein